MLIVDKITLDPAAFLPGGAELDLGGAGFRVLDGDFGEADVEVQLQRQALGEIPTDYHPPNTVTTLKLGVREEGEVDLPTAAHKLAQKVGEINEPGTEHWLQRDFDYKAQGEFAGPLGRRVFKATLQGLGSWQRGESPDVVLTLITGPYWYANVEAESAVFNSAEGARELIFELASVLGTAPGLIRIRVANTGASDWRGLILASESRDHPQDATADTTAALAYDAKALTPKGGSTEAEREGEKVLRHSELTAGWLTICDSEIVGVGHWTHKGVRRPWMRIWDPGSEAGDVQLKARWRTLGSLRWSENTIVPTPLVDDWALIDLGEARPEPAALGDERWQLQIQARAVSGAGAIDLQRIYPLPTEQFVVLKAPDVSQGADEQSQQSPGAVATEHHVPQWEEVSEEQIPWSTPANAKTSDNAYASASVIFPKATEALLGSEFVFAVPAEATIVGISTEVERSKTGTGDFIDASVCLLKGGIPVGEDKRSIGTLWPAADAYQAYGGEGDLWGATWTAADVNAAGFGVLVQAQKFNAGTATARVDHVRITVYYTEAADENRVCFATRSTESRSDGIFRQHPTDDVWGQLVPEGATLPYVSPSGLEGRKSRFIVIATQGDLGELPDGGSNKLSGQVFTRSGYHFAREAS